MTRYLLLSLTLLVFIACTKHNGSSSVPGGSFFVSVDTATGSVTASTSPDTFLVHLNNPAIVTAVPVVLHVPGGGRPDQGTRLNDSIWLDTLDLSLNAMRVINVTIGGKTTAYRVGYEFFINVYHTTANGVPITSFFQHADTFYVGTTGEILYSITDGLSFLNIPAEGLGTNSVGINVNGMYVSGDTVDFTMSGAIFLSGNRGLAYTHHDIAGTAGLFVQGDTLYVPADSGMYVSRDAGATFVKDDAGLPPAPICTGLYALGSTIYMSTSQGLAISTNGGASFTLHTNDPSSCVSVQNGTIYVGTNDGLQVSTDGGASFTTVDVGGLAVNDVAVSGQTVCAATNNGLFLSRDGGARFITLGTVNGLANPLVSKVAIFDGTVFAGYADMSNNPPIAGNLTVIATRR